MTAWGRGIGSGDEGDLRYCINQANADDQSNTIVFDPTVFGTPQTITLSGGPLELENTWGTQTITGPAAGLTISGGGSTRVFQVDGDVTASISGLTISGGNGGGLYNGGSATLNDCTLSDNTSWSGGGVFNGDGATLTLTDCTVSDNTAVGDNTPVDANGGGVANLGVATLINCTLSGNDAAHGGGVFNGFESGASLTLTDCTISGNSAAALAGGLYSSLYNHISLTNTIVAGNTGPSGYSDIDANNISGSNNLIGTGVSGGLINGVDGNIVGSPIPCCPPWAITAGRPRPWPCSPAAQPWAPA